MGTKEQVELKPGTVYGCNTVLGPGTPEMIDGRRYVRVECWPCKERRDVAVDNLIKGKCKRCRRCAAGRRRTTFQLHTCGGSYEMGYFDAL